MPHTIAENLQRLTNATASLKTAITTKGGTVGAGDGLEDLATAVSTIPSGDDSGYFIKESLPITFNGNGNNLDDYIIYGKQGGLNGVCPNVYTTINDGSIHRGYWGEWYTSERYLPDEPAYNRSGAWEGLCNEIYLDVGTYTLSVYIKTEDVTITEGVYLYIVEYRDFPKYSQAATVTLPGTTTPTVGTLLETVTNSWQRYTFTFDITVAGYVAPRVEKKNSDGTNIIITCYQLEKGATASPYVAYNTPGITINVNDSTIFFPLDEPLGPDDTLTMADTGVGISTINGLNTITTPIVGGFDMKIKGGISSLVLGTKAINSNGTYQASTDNNAGYTEVSVNVPNSYVADDEGKVVSNGALVAQTSSSTNANGTVDTTLINSLSVSVPNTYVAGDEGKVVSNGTLVAQSSSSTTTNGTVDTTLINSLDVDVANTYVAGDEGKVVYNGALVAQTAYPTELKENDTYDTTNYNSITVNVPARGYNHGGVNFFDVDGAILYSYTPEEFLTLTEMPPNPDRTYDWLTAQGWNWTLADAKAYVTAYGALNIGQHYITIDGKTAIHVLLPDGCLNPQLGLYLSGTVDVDWGDETEHETLTGTSSAYKYATHTYTNPGRYYILITVTSGTAIIKGGNSANKLFCKGGTGNNTPGNEAKKYTNCIQDIHIGSNMDIGSYAFYRCYSMLHVSIPSTVRSINSSSFQWNTSLQAVVIPEGVTSLGTSTFEGCYGLRFVSTPKSLTSLGQKCFSQCYSVIALTFSNSMTSVDQKCFADTPSCDLLQTPGVTGALPTEFCARNRTMMDFTIPEGVTEIGQDAFTYCYGIMNVSVPTTLRTTKSNAFSYCQALKTIEFPDEFTTMGDSTFESCSALQEFKIPSSMTAIPAKAFNACASLSYIVIPSGITSIASAAFSGCYGLAYIKFEGTTPPSVVNSAVWSNIQTDCAIFVPQNGYESYISAANYPSPSSYTYYIFDTYTSGGELPNMMSGVKTYDLTWYASRSDAISQTNPITEGNGKEIYARVVEHV